MIPFYDFSTDYMTNMKRAYEQGAKDMQRKIYYEMSKCANSQEDFECLVTIRDMKVCKGEVK